MAIGTNCTGSCKSKYHTITTAPQGSGEGFHPIKSKCRVLDKACSK